MNKKPEVVQQVGPDTDRLYELLTAPFDQTFTDVRGGVELTYVTGEQ